MQLIGCLRHPWHKDTDEVFLNKQGRPLNMDTFRADYWNHVLAGLEIRQRKFYAMRHTFITEAVKAGHNLKAIADYCGTSTAMIESQYCGKSELDQTIFKKPQASNYLNELASQTLPSWNHRHGGPDRDQSVPKPSWNQLLSWLKELDFVRHQAVV